MTVENLASESTQMENIEALTSQKEEEATTIWNGRMVNKGTPKMAPTNIRFLNHASTIQQGLNSSSFTIENASLGNHETKISLCGEKVDVNVSGGASANTDGDKSVDAKVEVSDKEGNYSGSVSQDNDGNTSGEMRTDFTMRF